VNETSNPTWFPALTGSFNGSSSPQINLGVSAAV